MADPTALDLLCARVPFHDADAPLRALVLRQLADTELHAALVAEPAGDRAELRMFDLPGGPVALAFDDAAALAEFLGGPVAHVSLPGRVLARELAGAGRGLLVNPGRPSEMLLDAGALEWLCAALAGRPETAEAAPRRIAEAERMLIGRPPNLGTFQSAAHAVIKAVRPLDDANVSADYRLGIVRTMVTRALRNANPAGTDE